LNEAPPAGGRDRETLPVPVTTASLASGPSSAAKRKIKGNCPSRFDQHQPSRDTPLPVEGSRTRACQAGTTCCTDSRRGCRSTLRRKPRHRWVMRIHRSRCKRQWHRYKPIPPGRRQPPSAVPRGRYIHRVDIGRSGRDRMSRRRRRSLSHRALRPRCLHLPQSDHWPNRRRLRSVARPRHRIPRSARHRRRRAPYCTSCSSLDEHGTPSINATAPGKGKGGSIRRSLQRVRACPGRLRCASIAHANVWRLDLAFAVVGASVSVRLMVHWVPSSRRDKALLAALAVRTTPHRPRSLGVKRARRDAEARDELRSARGIGGHASGYDHGVVPAFRRICVT
jgi:hypothetical protein